MAKALTAKSVDAVKASSTRREIPDPALSGLYLIVQPSGIKSWALRYRFAGKPSKLTLGRWPAMGVAEARMAASEAIQSVELGKDPSAAKKAKRAALLADRDKVSIVFEQYAKRHLSGLKSGDLVKRELTRLVLPVWGDRQIYDVTKRDVIELLDGIADSGRLVTANRIRAYVGKFLSWCVERDIIAASPAVGVKSIAKEASRERLLSDDEIRWFWRATDQLGQPWGQLGRMLLLTGQRLGEVAAMTQAEIQGDTWYLTADRTKNGRPHAVPLSGAARDVLSSIEVVQSQEGYYFTTNGRRPIQGYHKGRNHILEKMSEIAEQEIQHWTFHDLRRTAATGMQSLSVPIHVTEAVLNHVSGTRAGIVSTYQLHEYLEEKRSALEAWARLVLELTEGRSENVVRIGWQ